MCPCGVIHISKFSLALPHRGFVQYSECVWICTRSLHAEWHTFIQYKCAPYAQHFLTLRPLDLQLLCRFTTLPPLWAFGKHRSTEWLYGKYPDMLPQAMPETSHGEAEPVAYTFSSTTRTSPSGLPPLNTTRRLQEPGSGLVTSV